MVIIAVYRIAGAALVLAAIVTQLLDRIGVPGFSVANFFSFFTVLSNLFGAAVFGFGGVAAFFRTAKTSTENWDLVRGAAAYCMAITGIVFTVLLADLPEAVDTTLPWVNAVLHYIMPVVLVADWLIDPPRQRLPLRKTLLWLAIPAAYLIYSLIRGPFAEWYPYPFLDPRPSGYGHVALNTVAIGVGMAVLALALTWLGNLVGARRNQPTTPQSSAA